ncbi:hypothetical protein ACFSFY_10465 [Sporosarcina siberiensis]|uniref:Uncharacterized protein n=1 Tax=Sporosarcina siberiensis TaxID=1365606 RepID=A0ABW4SG45_9BACL
MEKRILFLEKEREELINTIEIMDKNLFEIQETVSKLEHVLIKIVENSYTEEFNSDLEYILLKHDVNTEDSYNAKMLPLRMQKAYKETGIAPTFQEFHNELLEIIGIEADDKENIPTTLTTKLLKSYHDDKDVSDLLTVIPAILLNK